MIRFIDIKGKNNVIEVAPGAHLYNVSIAIRGNNNKLFISKGKEGFSARIELIGDNNSISIGDIEGMFNTAITATNGRRIIIGKECVFSDQITISTTDHHPIFDQKGERLNPDQDVVIGDRVWIGRGVDILKGSVIGSDVVIGAKSVVTGTIPPNSVAVGAPARVVKRDIIWRIQ
jgi:acetyltransferase-like isoleucine patch superfamily enzyme